MTVFGDNFVLEGLRLPSVRERVEAVAARLMRIDPAYFAVCCCSDRDFLCWARAAGARAA